MSAASASRRWCCLALLLLLAPVLVACGRSEGPPLRVVATLAPFADWARRVGGERVIVTQLVPTGADPRLWEPSSADLEQLGQADVVLFNGLGLEPWLDDALLQSGAQDFVALEIGQVPDFGTVATPQRRVPRTLPLPDQEAPAVASVPPSVQPVPDTSPFVWLDPGPTSAQRAVTLIAGTLARADINNLEQYRRNSEAYNGELENLDAWIRRQVRSWPRIKTGLGDRVAMQSVDDIWDHFAKRYGITLRPSSQLRTYSPTLPDWTPLFVDQLSTAAQSGARPTRAPDGVLHSLGDDDYVRMMRANVAAIARGMHAAGATSASPYPAPLDQEP